MAKDGSPQEALLLSRHSHKRSPTAGDTLSPIAGRADDGMACDDDGSRNERLAAHPRSVARARDCVTAVAVAHGASAAQCHAIALAVSEAVANAIVHAYADTAGAGAGIIELRTWVDERRLVALVRDDGVGMGHAPESDGLGLGLALIARLSDHLEVESLSATPGTRVQMTFSID